VAGFVNGGIIGAMKYRKLRMAWSVAWGLAAVLLVVLWVRSYSTQDALLYRRNKTLVSVYNSEGVAGGYYYSYPPDTSMGNPPGIEWISNPTHYRRPTQSLIWEFSQQGFNIGLPAGCFVGVIALLATVVWLPLKSFSLRTLLIATTLVAVVLGLAVWAAR
jgi:hypothetical protein